MSEPLNDVREKPLTDVNEPLTDIREKLLAKKLRPSYHRMKVLEYLINNQNHPTVEQIFSTLYKEIPSLSKATVYNALNAFCAAGLIRTINIEDNEVRLDIITEDHGHFKCEHCGEIYNFRINIDNLPVEDLQGFKIDDKNIYFKGTCPRCLSKKPIIDQ